MITALSSSLGLILILTFTTSENHRALLLDYLIPSFLFFSIFLAIGLKKLMNRFVKNNIVHVSLLVILLLTQVGFNFPSSSHHNDKLVEIWGTELLNSLQPRSILILCGISPFAVYYLHLIKGLRQDVRLYDRFSFWTTHLRWSSSSPAAGSTTARPTRSPTGGAARRTACTRWRVTSSMGCAWSSTPTTRTCGCRWRRRGRGETSRPRPRRTASSSPRPRISPSGRTSAPPRSGCASAPPRATTPWHEDSPSSPNLREAHRARPDSRSDA